MKNKDMPASPNDVNQQLVGLMGEGGRASISDVLAYNSGMTKREHFALEIFTSLSIAMPCSEGQRLAAIDISVSLADKLLKQLEDTK